eukprot:Rhum_TRINITY_DN19169_c0_g1::Rhum_TRINITY_DN19169_c0_g1_i1::g.169463::m.169463
MRPLHTHHLQGEVVQPLQEGAEVQQRAADGHLQLLSRIEAAAALLVDADALRGALPQHPDARRHVQVAQQARQQRPHVLVVALGAREDGRPPHLAVVLVVLRAPAPLLVEGLDAVPLDQRGADHYAALQACRRLEAEAEDGVRLEELAAAARDGVAQGVLQQVVHEGGKVALHAVRAVVARVRRRVRRAHVLRERDRDVAVEAQPERGGDAEQGQHGVRRAGRVKGLHGVAGHRLDLLLRLLGAVVPHVPALEEQHRRRRGLVCLVEGAGRGVDVAPELVRRQRLEVDDGGHRGQELQHQAEALPRGGAVADVPGVDEVVNDGVDDGGREAVRHAAQPLLLRPQVQQHAHVGQHVRASQRGVQGLVQPPRQGVLQDKLAVERRPAKRHVVREVREEAGRGVEAGVQADGPVSARLQRGAGDGDALLVEVRGAVLHEGNQVVRLTQVLAEPGEVALACLDPHVAAHVVAAARGQRDGEVEVHSGLRLHRGAQKVGTREGDLVGPHLEGRLLDQHPAQRLEEVVDAGVRLQLGGIEDVAQLQAEELGVQRIAAVHRLQRVVEHDVFVGV